MRRVRFGRLTHATLAVAAAVSVALAAPTKPSRDVPPPASPPAVELVESVPVETSLGNPKLRRAAEVWPELIRSATTSIDLEQFYLSTLPDEPLEPVLKALVEAAKRGVRVRLLLDARMHSTYPLPADSLARIPGFNVRVIDMGKIAGGIQHSKYFVIDGRVVFLGSQNFDWRALNHIHELGVVVRDERLAVRYQQVFDMDWTVAELQATSADSSGVLATVPPAGTAGPLPVVIVQAPGDTVTAWPSWNPRSFSPDSTLWDRDAIVRALDSANREVVVQSLQYSFEDRRIRDDSIDQALRRAAARGTRIKLLVSDWQSAGSGMRALDSLAEVSGIEVRLSSVPEWSKAYIPFARVEHCKYMVVDSVLTWIGTSNWEPSYFHTSRNVAVTLRNRPLALAARESFEASWKASTAHPVHRGVSYPVRSHGDTAPAGARKYGR
jgi:phosphatidylserine/phosphatidylglycerophosphate/cardiolipin synthase-like enzyme